ncbi:hypothetical protein TrRE_jg4250 [Triparma retinervis]|jgi:ATP-dependent RNA helicase DDX47/RRP3|uniref:RNA helicase n=1 Tax=Triparma retinervis TaxID=2557542 RepID=A0A9W7G6D6_9STRA|nr:hypothetical protein TrRE_jg4250 [Triparma retinervis]
MSDSDSNSDSDSDSSTSKAPQHKTVQTTSSKTTKKGKSNSTTSDGGEGGEVSGESEGVMSKTTFSELQVAPKICDACKQMGWITATTIQSKAIPHAIAGRDVIGLAETGSGKTGSFAIPILQRLLDAPQKLFAVVLAPTRELAFQIHEVFDGLGQHVGSKVRGRGG